MHEERAGNSLRAWAAPFFILILLSLTPIIIPLSYRNIAAQVMLMGIAAALYPGVLSQVTDIFQLHQRNQSITIAVISCLLVFLLYALLASFWSTAPDAWLSVCKLFFVVSLSAALLAFGQQIMRHMVERIAIMFMLSIILGGWLIGVEALSGSWIRDMIHEGAITVKDSVSSARGGSIAVFLFVPLVYALITDNIIAQRLKGTGRKLVIISVGGAILAAALIFILVVNLMAFVFAAICGLAVIMFGGRVYHVLLKVAVLMLIFTPFLFILLPSIDQLAQMNSIPVSWLHRLIVWRFSAEEILSGPVQFFFGSGPQSAWALSINAAKLKLEGATELLSVMPAHPHNLFIQLWLEFGLIGVSLITVIVIQLLRYNITNIFSRQGQAAICAVLGAFLVFAMIEINLWSYWRLAMTVLAMFGILLVQRLES